MAIEAPVNGVSTTLNTAITTTSQTSCVLTSSTGFTNPAGLYLKWSATTATLANQLAVTC